MTEPGFIAAVLKWVDLRPDVDPLAGTVRHVDRTCGFSLADAAALECALLLGEAWQLPVAAITAGPKAAASRSASCSSRRTSTPRRRRSPKRWPRCSTARL